MLRAQGIRFLIKKDIFLFEEESYIIAMAAEPADLSYSCNTHLPEAFTEMLLTERERLLKAVAVTKGSIIESAFFFYSSNPSGAIKGLKGCSSGLFF